MPEEETEDQVLDQGGCQWRDGVVDNGHSWNPRVLPYGEVQCVTCTCKVIWKFLQKFWNFKNISHDFLFYQDGHVSCRRRHCRTLNCRYKIYDEGTCCPRCAVNRAEVSFEIKKWSSIWLQIAFSSFCKYCKKNLPNIKNFVSSKLWKNCFWQLFKDIFFEPENFVVDCFEFCNFIRSKNFTVFLKLSNY